MTLDDLTLKDLWHVLGDGSYIPEETHDRLVRAIRGDPRFLTKLRRLEELEREAEREGVRLMPWLEELERAELAAR